MFVRCSLCRIYKHIQNLCKTQSQSIQASIFSQKQQCVDSMRSIWFKRPRFLFVFVDSFVAPGLWPHQTLMTWRMLPKSDFYCQKEINNYALNIYSIHTICWAQKLSWVIDRKCLQKCALGNHTPYGPWDPLHDHNRDKCFEKWNIQIRCVFVFHLWWLPNEKSQTLFCVQVNVTKCYITDSWSW